MRKLPPPENGIANLCESEQRERKYRYHINDELWSNESHFTSSQQDQAQVNPPIAGCSLASYPGLSCSLTSYRGPKGEKDQEVCLIPLNRRTQFNNKAPARANKPPRTRNHKKSAARPANSPPSRELA